jgi:hypothetical protein
VWYSGGREVGEGKADEGIVSWNGGIAVRLSWPMNFRMGSTRSGLSAREIAAKEIGRLFGLKPRSAALLCRRWVEAGFLEVTNPSRKSRRYKLGDVYEGFIHAMNRFMRGRFSVN